VATHRAASEQGAEEKNLRRQHAAKPIGQRPTSAIKQQSFASISQMVARFKIVAMNCYAV
jgi:hypothetical protein